MFASGSLNVPWNINTVGASPLTPTQLRQHNVCCIYMYLVSCVYFRVCYVVVVSMYHGILTLVGAPPLTSTQLRTHNVMH